MATQAHTHLWASLRDDLRLKLGEDLFEHWIAPLRVLSEAGDEVQLGAANRFVLAWVEKRYVPHIVAVLKEKVGREMRVRITVDPEQFRERRRQEEVALQGLAQESRAQETLEIGRHEEQTLESFVIGASNQLAYNAATEVLERPGSLYNPLFIFGPTGVGKTHLLKGLHKALRARRRRAGPHGGRTRNAPFLRVAYLTGEQFFQRYVASIQERAVSKFQARHRSLDVLILDDVHVLVNKRKTQLEFLYTFSSLVDAGAQIILASDVPPKALQDLDPGLMGRFSSGLVVGVKKPEYVTRLGIARAEAQRLASRLGDTVLEFVAESVRGNAREIAGAVKQLHHHAQLSGGQLDLEGAREVLAELIRERERRVDVRKIHHVVAQYYGLPSEALVSTSRQRHIAFARQVAMHLTRRYTRKSLAEVGKYFGNRNHTTVRCAEVKIGRLLEESGQTSRDVATIVEILEE